MLVSATMATQSRTSFSASLGTTKDARKIGKSLFPVHRKATIPPRRRRFECCSSFVHCELAGCDVQARLVSRSCGSFRPTRPVHRRARHRRCHDGPPLRLPYASTSASPAFADLLLFLNGAAVAARRRTQRAVGPGQQAGVVPVVTTAGGTSPRSDAPRLRRPREGIRGGVARDHRMTVPACGRCVCGGGRLTGALRKGKRWRSAGRPAQPAGFSLGPCGTGRPVAPCEGAGAFVTPNFPS